MGEVLMRATDFVESYFDAWNHHNPEDVAGHLARGGVYCDIPEHAERTQDELVQVLARFFAEFHHRYELVGDVLAGANSIAFQYRMIPADDRVEDVYHGAEFIILDDEAALIIRDYYDVADAGKAAVPRGGSRRKYAKSGLNEAMLHRYRRRLEHAMRDEQIYLRADLTLPELAAHIGCSPNHLSQVINAGYGTGFFDYVNSHRIEHARMLLEAGGDEKPAIMNVAYSVGFNSNSSFYAAFKKHVGVTPARYRVLSLRNAAATLTAPVPR